LAALEEHVFRDGANPVIVLEPAGIHWMPVAVYLRSRHPECRLVKAKMQKVAALRRYLRGPAKSDRLDALTLAKMPFIDPEQLIEIYLPPANILVLQRLTRQRKRMESDVTGRKVRISAILDGYLPGVRRAFGEAWSSAFRAFIRARINPFSVIREGEECLNVYLSKYGRHNKEHSNQVFLACQNIVSICETAGTPGTLDEGFYVELQDEVARELRLLEASEAESEALAHRIEGLYQETHPSDNLQTIPGVGPHTAAVFLASVADARRFRNQSAFANWEGVVPGSRQSSNVEAKGLRMTKSGPSIMRMALYQAGEIARRYDPQLAALYHRQMVFHGKNHRQAMGAVMSHLGARVFRVLSEDRPYEIRDFDGRRIDRKEARKLVLAQCHVTEEVRRQRRRRNPRMPKQVDADGVSTTAADALETG
jgi:transposase